MKCSELNERLKARYLAPVNSDDKVSDIKPEIISADYYQDYYERLPVIVIRINDKPTLKIGLHKLRGYNISILNDFIQVYLINAQDINQFCIKTGAEYL